MPFRTLAMRFTYFALIFAAAYLFLFTHWGEKSIWHAADRTRTFIISSFFDISTASLTEQVQPDQPLIKVAAKTVHEPYVVGTENLEISANEVAIILVDVWSKEDSQYLTKFPEQRKVHRDIIVNNIGPVVEAARKKNIPILHFNAGILEHPVITKNWGRNDFDLTGSRNPLSKNFGNEDIALDIFAKKRSINTFIYMGFTLNICVFTRVYSGRQMEKRGYNVVLVEDGTQASEFAHTKEDHAFRRVYLAEFQSFGHTVKADALLTAIENLE